MNIVIFSANSRLAYEKAGKPVVTRSVLTYGESVNTIFRRAQAFDSWAEQDEGGNQEVLRKMYGDEWDVILETLQEIVVRTDKFVSVYRPDLSRMETPATTN